MKKSWGASLEQTRRGTGSDHIAQKQIIAPALNSLVGGPAKLYEGSRGELQTAIAGLVNRPIKRGRFAQMLSRSIFFEP
ncbi:MAG TPA: hypothetical protein VGF82_16045 [Terracidiphilus sp.]|jgi:hypothetical protein